MVSNYWNDVLQHKNFENQNGGKNWMPYLLEAAGTGTGVLSNDRRSRDLDL